MDFKDSINQLADRIRKQGEAILTEEATKNAFIMPLIVALGYDVFDPSEVVPELDCDLRMKKGEKIDYAIMRGGEPVMLIECKHCKQALNLHDTQLQKYFVASKARFGVLTNGIEYRFYTDLDRANIMDARPFMVLDMLDLSDHDIERLKKFHKSYFNEGEILSTAQQLQVSLSIRNVINQEFASPSVEFVRYFVKELNENRSTPKLIEQYAPLIKKEIGNYIDDVISDRLNIAKQKEQTTEEKPEQIAGAEILSDGVITTQEELDAYNIVRSILRKEVDVARITYTDYKTYFVVGIDGKSWQWICRLYLKKYKYISFQTETGKGEDKIEIKSLDEIFNYSDRLVQSLKAVLK